LDKERITWRFSVQPTRNNKWGDQTFPDKKHYTKTNVMLNHDVRGRPTEEIPLEPSGLLGPFTIQEAVI
jgi:hypothetical protein